MKMFKKIISVLIMGLILFSMVSLAACEGGEVTYSVNVKDALGNPYTTGVVVQFMKNGTQVAVDTVDENGTASKVLESGKYDINLKFADESPCYFEPVQLSAKNNETDITLTLKVDTEPQVIYAGEGEYNAYTLNTGCTYVELNTDKRNYFLFIPTEAGNYEFSVPDNNETQIGYYGSTHFIQETSIAEVFDNKFTISVKEEMIGDGVGGTSVYVIGVDVLNDTVKGCVVAIERIGDPEKTLQDEPWTIYEKTVEVTPYTLPANAVIKEFDLTAPTNQYTFVLNETDGFYHLDSKDGPLVLVRLSEDCQYIACFETMLDRSGVVKYFFDENGEFLKKESYTECLLEYIECTDEKEGVYPLTEDLKYIIQQRGEYAQWWDYESSNFRFQDADGNNMAEINTEIAWLLMCCYIE